MEHSYFHKLSKLLWGVIVSLVVVLAMYVSFGRLLMSNVEQYEGQILQELNSRLPFLVEAKKVKGEWHFFSPELVFSGLKLTLPDSIEPPYQLNEGRLRLDVLSSLRTRSLQISSLRLDALSLRGELSENGKFSIVGFDKGNRDLREWMERFLLNIQRVDLTNNTLDLALPNNQRRQLELNLGLRRSGSSRTLEAKIFSQTTGTVSLIAKGVGNPTRADSFAGELYLEAEMVDLAAFQQLINFPSTVKLGGELSTQLWLEWEQGEPTLELALEGHDLVFTAQDDTWQLPADKISLEASLVERKDHWMAFVTDLDFQKGDIQLLLPRLQVDAWGDSLRLKTENISLAALNALLVDMSLTPDAIADVFDVLNTRGELSAVQLDIADTTLPENDWQLAANFRDLEVDSWRGAPGVRSARGFVELAPGGGYVILDSQSFSMNFPTVYKLPLFYEDFFGTINIRWDADDFTLSSGLLAATGEEGLANVLFGLNIPMVKNEVGLEMDLLVGLENFDPKYREKYLPYILSDSLLGWLQPSIGGGEIEEGGFLWRGNLRGNTSALKTIQLFFNIADIQLDYHADWPPVSDIDGIVLIDDTNVSVWSQSGKLYDSDIQYISVEAWQNPSKQMVLAIGGKLEGPAGDGLRVVNNSPIGKIVGSVFEDWEARGQLETELQLEVNLAAGVEAPVVDVKTVWRDVDLQIDPGNIPISGISGKFSYNSDEGFSSENLVGQLWGHELKARLRQGDSSEVNVDISTRINMDDVQHWLELDILAFARGETEADINIQVVPGEGTTLSVASQLSGVALDLPEPWGKAADQTVPLHISQALGGDASTLKLSLEPGLGLDLQLTGGRFTGAALAFNERPREVEPGVLRITGHSPLVDVQQWQAFTTKYIEDEFIASLEETGGLSVEVDRLGVDTLLIQGQDIPNVVFSVKTRSGWWDIVAETDWVAGELRLAPDDQQTSLDIQFLNLDQLEQLTLDSAGDGEAREFPDMRVSIQGLHLRGHLLGELEFILQNTGDTLVANDIVGNIAGLNITSDNPGTLLWSTAGEGDTTSLDAMFRFDDLSHTLKDLGYQQILETEKGQFDVSLRWPAAPQDFSLAEADGSFTIAVEEGRFISGPGGAAGALKVLNIFNLAEIISRLSMTHLFESGIPFHSVEGELILGDGKIEVANMEVDGSSSAFQFSGVADVASETLEGNLAITLPVANNLPWIVALTAGWPVAAGVFVVSKVFKKQVNRFSSGVYEVSGPWDDPQMKFVRIFDDSSTVIRKSKAEVGAGQVLPGEIEDPNAPPDSAVASYPNALVSPEPGDPNEPPAQESSE